MVHQCVINSVVMWLHILVGPCWCVYVALFRSRLSQGMWRGDSDVLIMINLDVFMTEATVKSFVKCSFSIILCLFVQGGSNMTGTDLCVNKPHCAAAVRP